MNKKEFFSKLFSRYLLIHFAAMLLVVALVVFGITYGLDWYTHHGQGIEVPQVQGMNYNKARLKIDELGLTIVVSDSGYNKQKPADCILAQSPGPGAKVKEGHTIYVTVNSPSSPTFAIPDIVDNASVREAEAKLTAMGFKLTPPQKVTGEKDWVYGIMCRGRRVSNGDRIPIDYPLTLMVGSGAYDESEDYEYVDPTYDAPEIVEGVDGGDVDEFVEVNEP